MKHYFFTRDDCHMFVTGLSYSCLVTVTRLWQDCYNKMKSCGLRLVLKWLKMVIYRNWWETNFAKINVSHPTAVMWLTVDCASYFVCMCVCVCVCVVVLVCVCVCVYVYCGIYIVVK